MFAKPALTFTKKVNKKDTKLYSYSIESIINTIGRKRTLLVLLQLKQHKILRNKQIAKNLGGISPSTLSSILHQLIKEGFIRRKVYGEIPPLSVEYSLTKNGMSFLKALEPVFDWLERHSTKKDT